MLQEWCFHFPFSIFYPEEEKTSLTKDILMRDDESLFPNPIPIMMHWTNGSSLLSLKRFPKWHHDLEKEKCRNVSTTWRLPRIFQRSSISDFNVPQSQDLWKLFNMLDISNFLVNLIKSSHNVLTTSDLVQIYLTQIVWIGLLRNSFPVKHLVASSPHYLCKGELMQGEINCESFWKPNGYKFF